VSGEIFASAADPNSSFYLWLFESYEHATCAFNHGPPTNGHRWNILTSVGVVGFGSSGRSVGDFGSGGCQTTSGSRGAGCLAALAFAALLRRRGLGSARR